MEYLFASYMDSERKHCADDFFYFCKHYLRFDLYEYQKRLYYYLDYNNNVIFSKYRGGGFSSVVIAYCLWLLIFKEKQSIKYLISKKDTYEIFDKFIRLLPYWMLGEIICSNYGYSDSFTVYEELNIHGNRISFFTNLFLVSFTHPFDLFVVDEICDVWTEELRLFMLHENLIRRCIIFGCVYTDADWFYTTLEFAKLKVNKYKAYTCHYKENPNLQNVDPTNLQNADPTKSTSSYSYEQTPIKVYYSSKSKEEKKRKFRYLDEE